MNAYERVQAARAKGRPTAMRYIENIFTDFIEMHGDRRFADDPAVVAGIACLEGRPVTVIGLEKGVEVEEKVRRNFGAAHPEGYRKALRQMKLAEKFRRPVVCFVDTSGAFCGIGAEERGEGQSIAENLRELMGLRTPVIAIVIGEGGSGGALALAAANEVWMLENAVYSVISPEGAASILWKDAGRTQEASESLKLTAQDLLGFGVIERVFDENGDWTGVYAGIRAALVESFIGYGAMTGEQLAAHRYDKFRRIGRTGEAT